MASPDRKHSVKHSLYNDLVTERTLQNLGTQQLQCGPMTLEYQKSLCTAGNGMRIRICALTLSHPVVYLEAQELSVLTPGMVGFCSGIDCACSKCHEILACRIGVGM